ncbi:hypothetical protein MMC14_010302 [Varicellaria rhodocarpa]|nr:hypothetical protein [Varicellaria rhodocarpa]
MAAVNLPVHQRSKGASPPFHFLTLPTEIRMEIYEYIFGVPTFAQLEISINLDRYTSSDTGRLTLQCSKRPEFHLELAIFRTSKHVYREALPALYNRCIFFPVADENVIEMFFGNMSDFTRLNISKLYLRPRPQKNIRRIGPRATNSQVLRGPLWTLVCEKISILFVALEELFIHLHPMYGHDLWRGDEIDWIIRPLSRLWRVEKILASVGNGSENTKTPEMVDKWKELTKKADHEAEEYAACRNRIMETRESWPNPYWVMKRSKTLKELEP